MASVTIHPPKTPITTGSDGVAKATLPNVCKMPGPPAPFVPTALPNIARSGTSPKNYSTTVKVEGHAVAIRGASFRSTGDMASKGTGGGLVSANTHGPARFITPGTMTVKIEGKGVHLLGDPVLNNCGVNGTPPNTGATMTGTDQKDGEKAKGKRCSPACESPLVKKVDRQEEIAKAQDNVEKSSAARDAARQKHEEAQKALADRLAKKTTGSPGTDTLRKAVPRAAASLEAAEAHLMHQREKLDSLRFEEKVAVDCGGGENWVITCADCGHLMGDFDVVTKDGRVKEVKSSADGFQKKKDQFAKLQGLVEGPKKLMGPAMTMKVAVPEAVVTDVTAANPELKGKIQGH